MRPPWWVRHPRVTIGAGIAIAVIGLVGLVLNMTAPPNFDSRAGEVLLLLGVPADALVGAFLVARRPDNPLGHLLVLVAFGIGVDSPAKAVLNSGFGGVHSAVESWALWIDNTTWTFTYFGIALLVLHYPDGRLPGPRWAWVRRTVVVAWAAMFVICALAPRSADDAQYPGVTTPLDLHIDIRLFEVIYLFPFGLIVAAIGLGIVGMFLRARRSHRLGDVVTGAQIRWLAWAGVIAVVMVPSQSWIDALVGDWVPWLGNVVSELGPYTLLVAVVVAVTRYGLFEIDRVVSRTVAYVLLTGLLLGTYVGIIAGLSALLPANVNSLVVAAATLAVAALFVPVRRRVQAVVDRRFNRRRYDRARLVERYAESLRRRTIDEDVTTDASDLLTVVHEALEPRHAGLWLVAR